MSQNPFKIISSAVSDRGLSDKRPVNEDSYLEMPERGIFAVADGVGGAQAGDFASQMAMEIIGEAFSNPSNTDPEHLMEAAISRANGAIYQMSRDLPQLATMATTVVALHIQGNIVAIGHVGDSRIYRLDPRGDLYRETQDHSVVEDEVRAGRLTPQQALNHPSRNIISRAVGADAGVEVDLKTMMIEPNTMFLLCSDGVTRHITDQEIHRLLYSGWTPNQICMKIKEICYARGAEDNLTALIIKAEERLAAELADETTIPAPRKGDTVRTLFSDAMEKEHQAPAQRNVQQRDLRDTQPLQPMRDTLSPYDTRGGRPGQTIPNVVEPEEEIDIPLRDMNAAPARIEVIDEVEIPLRNDPAPTPAPPEMREQPAAPVFQQVQPEEQEIPTQDLRVNLPESVTGIRQDIDVAVPSQEVDLSQTLVGYKTSALDSIDTAKSASPTAEVAAPATQQLEQRMEVRSEDSIFGGYGGSEYRDERTLVIDEGKGSFLGKLIQGLLFVLIGLMLGLFGSYFYNKYFSSADDKPQPITEAQSPNPTYTSFENLRREVDKDPQKFITATASTADDAEDYYLLGRAYLRIGKYPEAKEAFTRAKQRLAQAPDINKYALEADINVALAAISNPFAEKEMEKLLPPKKASAKSEGNSSNSGGNSKAKPANK